MDDDLVNDLEEQLEILNEEYSNVTSELSSVKDELKEIEEKFSTLESKYHDTITSYVSRMSSMAIEKAESVSEHYYECEKYSFIDNFSTTIEECCPHEFSESLNVIHIPWNHNEHDDFETVELFSEYTLLIDMIFNHVSQHYKTAETENSSFHETIIDPILENMGDPDMMIATVMLLNRFPEYILSKIHTFDPIYKMHILRLLVRAFFTDRPRTVISDYIRQGKHIQSNFYLNIMRLLMILFVEKEIKAHFHKNTIELIKNSIIAFVCNQKALFNSIIVFYISGHENVNFISDDAWNAIVSNEKAVSNVLDFIINNRSLTCDAILKTSFVSNIPQEARKVINLHKLKG